MRGRSVRILITVSVRDTGSFFFNPSEACSNSVVCIPRLYSKFFRNGPGRKQTFSKYYRNASWWSLCGFWLLKRLEIPEKASCPSSCSNSAILLAKRRLLKDRSLNMERGDGETKSVCVGVCVCVCVCVCVRGGRVETVKKWNRVLSCI